MEKDRYIHFLSKVSSRQKAIDVLLDDNQYADIVLKNARIVNVITREIYDGDLAISGEEILLVGDCTKLIGKKTTVYDMTDKYVMPGFIDSHMHFESAMLTITEFSRLSIPTGTTCLISDPHEIGNVLGAVGIRAMCEEAALMPQHVHSRVPAMVPDSPGLETAGCVIRAKDMSELLFMPSVSGIGETQGTSAGKKVYDNNPSVFYDNVVASTFAESMGKKVDGNAPGLKGAELAAHIIAGATDVSCHETTAKDEALEKLRQGVYVLMREGSTQRNMKPCIEAILENNLDSRRAILATDDMLAEDIARDGHMNDIIRRTIKAGVDPVTAIQMATINAATWQGFKDIGVLAPGKLADIAVVEGKLEDMRVSEVFLKGQLVAQKGKLLIDLPPYTYPDCVKNSVKCARVTPDYLKVASSKEGKVTVRCIELILDENLTGAIEAEMLAENGFVKPDLERDLLPIAVVGRHGQNTVGSSFVKGFKMKRGAIAETVSHDTHNLMVMGTNYEDMAVAVNRIIELKGGLVLACDGEVVDEMPLRIGGLMTDELSADELAIKMADLTRQAKEKLECQAHAPFMHLAFLSLSTSPVWKIADRGIIDAENYCLLPTIKE